jgi:hypothetical protein
MMDKEIVNGLNKKMEEAHPNPNISLSREEFFEIHVKGHLDNRWSEWLEGLEVNLLENGEMMLVGPIRDQAALMGLLNKLSRLNLTLLSVNRRQNERSTNTQS